MGKDVQSHLANITTVFSRLRDTALKVKPSKCEFFKREVKSVLDYIICSSSIVGNSVNFFVHPEHPLNLSDHLPLSASFCFSCPSPAPPLSANAKINWSEAKNDGSITLYSDAVSLMLEPLLHTSGQSICEFNNEIVCVVSLSLEMALSALFVMLANLLGDNGTQMVALKVVTSMTICKPPRNLSEME
uniref:Uncharacterized protein n=1 Tax=Amphimedon queenslandica TaxID=400682 RepID=A0A1X7UVK6_AMPQE